MSRAMLDAPLIGLLNGVISGINEESCANQSVLKLAGKPSVDSGRSHDKAQYAMAQLSHAIWHYEQDDFWIVFCAVAFLLINPSVWCHVL